MSPADPRLDVPNFFLYRDMKIWRFKLQRKEVASFLPETKEGEIMNQTGNTSTKPPPVMSTSTTPTAKGRNSAKNKVVMPFDKRKLTKNEVETATELSISTSLGSLLY